MEANSGRATAIIVYVYRINRTLLYYYIVMQYLARYSLTFMEQSNLPRAITCTWPSQLDVEMVHFRPATRGASSGGVLVWANWMMTLVFVHWGLGRIEGGMQSVMGSGH